MTAFGRVPRLLVLWLAILALALLPSVSMRLAHAQDSPGESSPAPDSLGPRGTPDLPPGDGAAARAGSAGDAPVLLPTPPSAPLTAATGASCSGAYGLYADSTGHYTTAGCGSLDFAGTTSSSPAAGGSLASPCPISSPATQPGAGPLAAGATPLAATSACQPATASSLVPTGQVAPCQLFPSGSQPSTSTVAAQGIGAPPMVAASAAPRCQAASGGQISLSGSGAPACQLYPSASQPTSSTFGAANYPVTPVPAPAQVPPPRGTLAGAAC